MESFTSRRIIKVLPKESDLLKAAASKKLRVYIGIDPTATRLHLGHTIGLNILMDFANAGHEAILLFGTGTVLVGDPSLRDTARKLIDTDMIEKNIASWKKQVSPLIDFDKIEIKKNGDWLIDMSLRDIISLGSHISATQLFKRESFTRRIAKGDTVWYHETMYPLLQGYDSVAMDVDVEIGGTDQEFNMLMGRELQRKINNREKYIVENPMILGTDGKQMSKTSGNCIWLEDKPQDMFGKLMTCLDDQIFDYLTLLTSVPEEEINELRQKTEGGNNPRDAKLFMAEQVVGIWHGDKNAKDAKEAFINQFSKKLIPDDIDQYTVSSTQCDPVQLVVDAGLESSKTQARRLLDQGAIKLNSEKVKSGEDLIVASGDVLQAGKRRFVKLIVK